MLFQQRGLMPIAAGHSKGGMWRGDSKCRDGSSDGDVA